MKNKKTWLHIAAIAGIVLSALLAVFSYRMSYIRLWTALGDLWCAVRSYFCMLFDVEFDSSRMAQLPKVDLGGYLPFDFVEVQRKLRAVWHYLFKKEPFLAYLNLLLNWCYQILMIASMAIPLWFAAKRVFLARLFSQNNDYNAKTKALVFWQARIEPSLAAVKRAVAAFFSFVSSHCYGRVFLVLWCLNLNEATILVEAGAYYLEFAATVSFVSLLVFAVKLIVDTIIMLYGAPAVFWLGVAVYVLGVIRKKIGYRRLEHMERRNRGFINVLPIASLTVGTIGASKTTHITDFAISQEIMFRDKALELMQKNERKFPYFPWINVELEIKSQVEQGCINNLATVEDWAQRLREQFEEYPTQEMLFGYDFAYGFAYQDDLHLYDLFEVIETYAKLYLIYMVESALVVSNYSIRLDFQRDDLGNFPIWNHSLFQWDVTDVPAFTQTAHVIDFDMMRLGRKLVEDNAFTGALEFGVIVCSEVGKERKNNLEMQEMKRNADATNQKNDLMDYWLKMCRHGAVVDNFPFIKFFSDEQRPESLGANSRDLFQVVRIREVQEQDIALPFYAVEGFLYEWLAPKYAAFHTEYRFYRGDNTLTEYLIKRLATPFFSHCERLQNRFGYTCRTVTVEDGTLDGERQEYVYFLMPKKVYADRFRTNSFKSVFRRRARKYGKGLIDRQCYESLDPTEEELLSQNSYAVNEMYSGKIG